MLMSRYGVSAATPYLLVGLRLWLATLQPWLHAAIARTFGARWWRPRARGSPMTGTRNAEPRR